MDVYLVLGLAAGSISMGLLTCRQRGQAGGLGRELLPTQLLEAFLTGAMLAPGVRVCGLALDSAIAQFTSDDRLYVFAGGLTIILLAVYGVRRLMS